MSYAEDEGSGRPKLSLQPRGSLSDSSPSPAKSSKVRGDGLCGSVVQLCLCASGVMCWRSLLALQDAETGAE
jgi:hypothetical protein